MRQQLSENTARDVADQHRATLQQDHHFVSRSLMEMLPHFEVWIGTSSPITLRLDIHAQH